MLLDGGMVSPFAKMVILIDYVAFLSILSYYSYSIRKIEKGG